MKLLELNPFAFQNASLVCHQAVGFACPRYSLLCCGGSCHWDVWTFILLYYFFFLTLLSFF